MPGYVLNADHKSCDGMYSFQVVCMTHEIKWTYPAEKTAAGNANLKLWLVTCL